MLLCCLMFLWGVGWGGREGRSPCCPLWLAGRADPAEEHSCCDVTRRHKRAMGCSTLQMALRRRRSPPCSHACPAGAREKQYEALIRRTLEAVILVALHPRALIQVVVQVGRGYGREDKDAALGLIKADSNLLIPPASDAPCAVPSTLLGYRLCAKCRKPAAAHAVRRRLHARVACIGHPHPFHGRPPSALWLQVVSDDGGVLACAINAACAALVDAAVPLRTLCAAVSAAQQAVEGSDASSGALLLDPSAAEEASAAATGTFAYLPLLSGGAGGTHGSSDGGQLQLLASLTCGRLTSDQLLDMMEAGKQGADRLAAFMQQAARQGAGA